MRNVEPAEISGHARSRALRILVGYITEILGVRALDIGEPFLMKSGSSRINYSKMSSFFRGHAVLSANDLEILIEKVIMILKNRRYSTTVQSDYAWLRPLLLDIGIQNRVLLTPSDRDSTLEDMEFLRTFRSGINRIATENQEMLHDRIGGLWYIIRQSTDIQTSSELTYNISLLNVKPTRYVSSLKGDYENVATHLLHFSFRARFGQTESGILQLYRGRILAVDKAIYFLGERHHIGMVGLFMMAWAMPVQEIGRRQEVHVQTVQGVIMTGNSSDIPIVSPAVGQYIQPEGIQRPPGISDIEWARKEAEHHEYMINVHSENIGVCSETEIRKLSGINTKEIISYLGSNIEKGKMDGFFTVFPR